MFKNQSFKNGALYVLIGVVTLGITLTAFVDKAIKYQDEAGNVVLQVHKKEFKVVSQTTGAISEVRTDVGQHVRKGDIIAVIGNQVLDKQIAKLQELSATNASATVQLIALQTEKEAQQIYAPTDGVVASIISQGEAVNTLDKVATIYSDSSVQLQGTFSLNEYTTAQGRLSGLTVTDRRLAAEYPVTYVGLGQQVKNEQQYESNVVLYFTMANQDDATNLLQDERVILQLAPRRNNSRPIDAIFNWYRNVTGNQ